MWERALFDRGLGRVLGALVRLYQVGFSWLFRGACRFQPSCSTYALEALSRYGGVKGAWLAVKRLSRCQPFHPGGWDPVP